MKYDLEGSIKREFLLIHQTLLCYVEVACYQKKEKNLPTSHSHLTLKKYGGNKELDSKIYIKNDKRTLVRIT